VPRIGALPFGIAPGPGQSLPFGPTQPVDFFPFVIAALAVLVISFLARVIQPTSPHAGVYEAKPASPVRGSRKVPQAPGVYVADPKRAATLSPLRPPQVATQVLQAAARRQKGQPKRLGDIAARTARIVFGLLS
jgi:hypothetical protein